MSEKTLKRRMIRERVLQVLYAYEMNPEGLDASVAYLTGEIETEEGREFALSLIRQVVARRVELDALIVSNLNNWALERVSLIDKLIIRMGLAEILYFNEIPVKVSMNEALEIAKMYGTKDSSKFINGILDGIRTELAEEGKIFKSGSGLIDT
ncbi:MAG: transcription antitermination factor NusB [Ignavibacteriaceae bacterium]|nr:transcription antitermination factor NusB [Ignavibacteriaceae bacterium]